MGLITTSVSVKVNGHNLCHYKKMGYNCNKGDIIEVSVDNLTDGASNKIEYICDYCGQQYKTKFYNKKDTIKNHEKLCCNNSACQARKREDRLLEKYGVDNPMKIKENVEKAQNTCQKKYGTNNPAKVEQFKEKARRTNIDRYGVDKYGVRNPILTESAQQKLSVLGKEASKIQRYICSVYNGRLSVEIYPYIADIVMDDDIVCEVDGGGHFLKIELGQESESLFWEKEYGRENYIISKGYKILRIITRKNGLPDENTLLKIRELGFNYFRLGHNVFRYNLDDNTFRCY